MTQENMKLSAVLERTRLSFRLAAFAAFAAFALALTVLLAGPVYQWGGIGIFSLGLIPFFIAFIMALIALVQASFSSRMITEEEEKLLLEKRKENTTSLLDISEDVRFTAKRTLINFEKYAPPVTALLCCLVMTGSLLMYWNGILFTDSQTELLGAMHPKSPINLAFLSSMAWAFSFFLGIFLIGQSHVREFRFLRPVGTWLLTGALAMFLTGVAALFINYDPDKKSSMEWANFFTRGLLILLVALAVEFLINFIIEFYRPRTQMEERPVYESRILALFTEPGGLLRNIADSLDYQFGFKVSKTWIYSFFERAIIPGVIVWCFVLWLFTGVAEVSPGELGVRERFGAFVGDRQVLQPGIHLKLPWPFETIVRVPVDIVQNLSIGAQIDKTKTSAETNVILWSGAHYAKEDGFLVAIDKTSPETVYAVSILEASLPVSYKVRPSEVYQYAFNFTNVSDVLTSIGESEATAYFASTDFMKDISSGRELVAGHLRDRIQAAADKLKMGIDIVSVNLHDTHPPVGKGGEGQGDDPGQRVNVAEAFQQVFCAEQEAASLYYKAMGDSYKVTAEASIQKMKILRSAEAYRFETSNVAAADAFRFKSQLISFRAMPQMFKLRTYLDFLENDCAGMRKYVLSANIPSQIFELNMEEKPRLDLLDAADIGQLGK